MPDILLKLKQRLKDQSGGATIILGFALFVLLVFMAGFFIDFAKNVQIRNSYVDAGQRSTQAALIYQNDVGGLTKDSANGLINEYMLQTRGHTNTENTDVNTKDLNNAEANPAQTRDTSHYMGNCNANNMYPIITLRYTTGGSNPTATSQSVTSYGGRNISQNVVNDGTANNYNTIQADITDVSSNFFLGMVGLHHCQTYHVGVSAKASNSNEYQQHGNN